MNDALYTSRRSTRGTRPYPEKLSAEHWAVIKRLLSGRTRDLRLSEELAGRFRERSWKQSSKIIRAWMMWVVVLDLVTLAVNALLLPPAAVIAMLAPAAILPPAALTVAMTLMRPRSAWTEAAVLLLGVFAILLSVALVGVSAGGEFYERHLTIMLFVAVTAIIIFPVHLFLSIMIGAFAIGLYLVLQLHNPVVQTGSVLAGTLFFASGIMATIVARRTATLLAHKTFLLELQDRMRLDELTDANARLEHLARTDPLTGIANRRWMIESLHQIWSDRASRDAGISLLMCDVDHFKGLNDCLGHSEGDRCLVKVAGIIQSSLRNDGDRVARYGGEEFLIVLPGTKRDDAMDMAERIRTRVEAASLQNPGSHVAAVVTVSIGVAVLSSTDRPTSPETLQRHADEALYTAKNNGRNRAEIYEA